MPNSSMIPAQSETTISHRSWQGGIGIKYGNTPSGLEPGQTGERVEQRKRSKCAEQPTARKGKRAAAVWATSEADHWPKRFGRKVELYALKLPPHTGMTVSLRQIAAVVSAGKSDDQNT